MTIFHPCLVELNGERGLEFEEKVKLAREEDTPMATRKEAEMYIVQASKDHGELVIHGDQLTTARIESARFVHTSSSLPVFIYCF